MPPFKLTFFKYLLNIHLEEKLAATEEKEESELLRYLSFLQLSSGP